MESVFLYRLHAFGYVNVFKAGAYVESSVLYTSYTIGNIYVCQVGATIVFTTHCISIDFVLNGRKVTSWILRMVKMIKI